MRAKWKIYGYVNTQGRSAIGDWLIEKSVSERDRGQLLAKMDMFALCGSDLPSGLAGPIKSKRNKKLQSHIYKLIVHGDKCSGLCFARGLSI